MGSDSQHFRAYVVGTSGEQEEVRDTLQELSGGNVSFCFGTQEQSFTDLASGLRGDTAYHCVFFLFSFSEEDLSSVFRDFRKVRSIGLPIYAVPIFKNRDGIYQGSSLERTLPQQQGNELFTDPRLLEVERLALRFGAAGVIHLESTDSLPSYLHLTLSAQQKTDEIVESLEEPESYIQELERSELRYRNLVQLSRDLIWSVDAEGRWTFMNDAVYDILGYTPKEMIGRRFTEFQDAADASRDLITFSKVLEGTKYFDYETRYRTKDGERVTLSFNALVTFDDQGTVTGASGTAVDITAKKRAAEDLRNQKEFFRQVVDANPNRISVRNLSGQFVLANRAFAKTLRLDPDDLIGMTYPEVVSDARTLKILEIHDEQLKSNPSDEIVFESREVCSEHAEPFRWFQTTRKALLLPNQQEPYLLEVSVDLTERKLSEEALRHVVEGTAGATAEDYFPSLLHHLTSALHMRGGIIYRLDGSSERFSIVAQNPETLSEKDLSLAIDCPLFEKLIDELFISVSENASELLPSDLSEDYPTLLATLLTNSRNEPIGMLMVFGEQDTAKLELAEYMLTLFGERASAELSRITNESETKRLERQLLQAQKMEAIGTLAAGVAHDLNNALSAVAGHLQLLEGSDSVTPEQKQSLHIALDGCSRGSRLVHQLLGFSRQGKYVPERIQLKSSLEEMIEFLNCATRKDISIEIHDIPDSLFVHADKNQFQQVLMNLIINAQQAMPEGGEIRVEAESEFIKLPEQYNAKATQGEYTIITVSDTGTGIDSGIKEKIFEPFFTTKPAQVGTGLGLSMVYGIMQNHGGWVDVDSTSGEGSSFRIYFPRTVAVQKDLSQSDTRISEQPSILVIDDEPFLVDLTCRFLERSGFMAKGFTDPTEALRYYEKHQESIHLTILDMKMPQLDGKSCFLKLRAMNPDAQVVILSGFIEDEAARAVMEQGALHYFQKPLKYSELIDWVKKRFQPDPLSSSNE